MVNKIKIIVFLGSWLISFNFIQAQQNYNDYSTADKSELYLDHFENNSNQWITDNNWISAKFKDSHYDITCKNFNGSTGLTYKQVPIDLTADFEIETDMKIVKGTGALIFGMTDKFDHYRIEVTDRNELIILKNTPTRQKIDKLFSISGKGILKPDDYNKITVRKVKNLFFIFINEIPIGFYTNIKPEGTKIGFSVGLNSEISTDDIQVHNLKPLLPQISWQNPIESKLATGSNQFYLKVCLKSKSALESAKILINGVEKQIGKELVETKDDTCKWVIEYNLALLPGSNEVSFLATNNSGSVTSEKRIIDYQAKETIVAKTEKIENKIENNQVPVLNEPLVKEAPAIIWISPSRPNTELNNQYQARIKATIKSFELPQSVLVYLNGAATEEFGIKLTAGTMDEYMIDKAIELQPGDNSIYIVASNSLGSNKSELRNLNNPPDNPPLISWTTPTDLNSSINTENFTIEVCIKSASDLKSAKLMVNGEVLLTDKVFKRSALDQCNYVWQKEVILREGDNSVYVIAENTAGSLTSEKRVIKLEKAVTEKRLALVFGNSNYGERSLKNAVNDANLMESTLKSLGFDVIKRTDASRTAMEQAIAEFSRKLQDYNVALFYYAGHGIQVDGLNYLIPVDATLEDQASCKWQAISVNNIVEEFEKVPNNANIVILDACRNNPYRSWVRGGSQGFKFLTPVTGTIISFATSEGATAADGGGANGTFTEELVKQMVVPQSIGSVFMNTRKAVLKRTNNAQRPVEQNYLTGDYYLKK
jgi:hypothetical protein